MHIFYIFLQQKVLLNRYSGKPNFWYFGPPPPPCKNEDSPEIFECIRTQRDLDEYKYFQKNLDDARAELLIY